VEVAMDSVFENSDLQISIIIPVYNCGQYIEQCIKSVQAQTCADKEIICIDDGSTDNSVAVINEMQQSDSQIKLFRQSNKGAGEARNVGVQEAGGRYIAFLDADDYYCDIDALEKMVNLCDRNNVKVCGCTAWKKYSDETEKKDNVFSKGISDLKYGEIYDYCEFQFDYGYTNFIFSRDLIKNNNITFPSYRRFQDPPFMASAMFAAERFTVADTILYCYRTPSASTRYNNAKVRDLLKGLRDNIGFAYEKGLDILFQKSLERLEYEYISVICHNVSDDDAEILELLLEINRIAQIGLQDSHYIIRPLKRIITSVQFENANYGQYLLDLIGQEERIALYGAGKFTKLFISFLRKNGMADKVSTIVVSDMNNNPENVDGFPLCEIDCFTSLYENQGKLPYVFVTLCGLYHKEVESDLKDRGIDRFILVDDVFMEELGNKI
jgi:glycosyltransferase involved in cell wall biosynthesis